MFLTTASALAVLAATVSAVPADTVRPAPAGKKIQWVGHSFHWFLPAPVAKLATEAGIKGHVNIGVDRIGASLPCQHWNKGGDKGNDVKRVLQAGKADVLTLATREQAPDECIPKFVKLAASKRKDMHVMVQETWIVQSANNAKEGCEPWGCTNRDAATWDDIEATRVKFEQPYKKKLQTQLRGLNKELGLNFTSLVPVYDGVLSLRQMAVKGKLPGVKKQSALFKDKLGHAQKPLADMASYMWFAALYGINPKGMKSIAAKNAPPGQTEVLQKLAWDTLQRYPL